MAKTESDEERSSNNERMPQPYSPSWVNHLTAWVDRRPWPNWSFYLGLWLVLVCLLIAALWIEGVYPFPAVYPVQFFIPAMICLFLAVIRYLDDRSEAALKTLRPVLTTDAEAYSHLRYRLTTMPAWPTILVSVVTIAVIYLLGAATGETESSIEALAASHVAANLVEAVFWIGWWVLGAFFYHTIHQLRVIDRVYSEHTRAHLFAMSPLYAFSTVTALTAVTLVIAAYGWTALNPDNLSDPVSIVVVALITVLALGAFAWPLLGTRRILNREKVQRLDQVSLRYEAAFAELHQQIDDREFEEMDDLMKVITALETERDMLKSISTWPWQPETLRYLATALLLPLLLWIIQYILQLVLGS